MALSERTQAEMREGAAQIARHLRHDVIAQWEPAGLMKVTVHPGPAGIPPWVTLVRVAERKFSEPSGVFPSDEMMAQLVLAVKFARPPDTEENDDE